MLYTVKKIRSLINLQNVYENAMYHKPFFPFMHTQQPFQIYIYKDECLSVCLFVRYAFPHR